MAPLRWNWSANTRGSLKPDRISNLASPLSAAHTYEVALAASDGHFERALAPGLCRGLWRGVWPDARGASRAPTGPLGRQLTDTTVDHPFPAPFAPLGR
jgi:hypothetical protein